MAEYKKRWVERLLTLGLDIPGFMAFFKDFIKNGIEAKRNKNPRPDVVRTIEALKRAGKPEKAKIIMRRLERAATEKIPDFENDVVVALGEILPCDKDGNIIEQSAVQIYEWIADLSEESFSTFVYAMKHDPIWQMVKYSLSRYGLEGLKYVAGFLFEAGEELNQFGNEFCIKLEPTRNKFRVHARISRKGVWSWLDF